MSVDVIREIEIRLYRELTEKKIMNSKTLEKV